MEVSSAVALINNVIYKPGWKIEASDYTHRFEGTVTVKITYPATNSDREEAPNGYPTPIPPDGARASFPLIVTDCDDAEIYRRLLDVIIKIELHEAREFLRVGPTYWAPFHPHRVDGMRRFGDVGGDLHFGLT